MFMISVRQSLLRYDTKSTSDKKKNRNTGLMSNQNLLGFNGHYQGNEKAVHRIRTKVCKTCLLKRLV